MTKELDYHPERTIPGRRGPSIIARFVNETGFAEKLGIKRVLDYGCGKGIDIPYYRSVGFYSVGYDPYPPFGFSEKPKGKFDLVVCAFVLNVLPSETKRIDVIKSASEFLVPEGLMILVTRSPSAIAKEVKNWGWKKHSDGYWSSERRGIFQKGLSKQELTNLSKIAGLKVHPLDEFIKLDSYSTSLLIQKE